METQSAADRTGGTEKRDAVEALRGALRQDGADARTVDRASSPLIERVFEPLLRFCDKLARNAPRARVEGEDLALHAWQKMLRYLSGPQGDRVLDEEHFVRLLRRAARTRLLDILDQQTSRESVDLDAPLSAEIGSATRADLLRDAGETPEELLLPRDSRYLKLVEELFTDAKRFHQTYWQANQRHPRNYQALVLYQIGTHWREEIGPDSGNHNAAHLIRHYVGLLGVPPTWWEPVERAAASEAEDGPDGLCAALLEAVNSVCGTNLRSRGTLAVLRHEMNKFAGQCAM